MNWYLHWRNQSQVVNRKVSIHNMEGMIYKKLNSNKFEPLQNKSLGIYLSDIFMHEINKLWLIKSIIQILRLSLSPILVNALSEVGPHICFHKFDYFSLRQILASYSHYCDFNAVCWLELEHWKILNMTGLFPQ